MKNVSSVLIVEDDDWFAEQQIRTLSGAGFDVRRAANGLAAIEALDRRKPDVLVLDLFLPGPNAIALLNELQSYADLGSLPVIICSNSAADVPEGVLAGHGVRQMIDKTVMYPDDLVRAVKRVLV